MVRTNNEFILNCRQSKQAVAMDSCVYTSAYYITCINKK